MRRSRTAVLPLQSAPGECGVIAIAAATSMLGMPLCPAALRERYGVSARGLSLSQMLSILRAAGFEAHVAIIDPQRFASISCPAIALWRGNHFVTLDKVGRRYARIFDPEHGWARASADTITECLTGPCIEITKAPGSTSFALRRQLDLRRWLAGFQWKRSLAAVLGLALAAQVFVLTLPLLGRAVIDRATVSSRSEWAAALVALAAGLITSVVCRSLTARLSARVSARLGATLLLDLSRRLFAMPLSYFTRTQPTLLAAKAQTGGEVQALMLRLVSTTSIQAVVGLASLGIAFWLSPALGSVILSARLAATAIDRLTVHKVTSIAERRFRKSSILHSTVVELFQAASAIKTHRVTEAASEKISTASDAATIVEVEYQHARQRRSDVASLVTSLEHILFIWVGAVSISSAHITIGTFYALIAYKEFAAAGVREILDCAEEVKRVQAALTRVEDVVERASGGETAATEHFGSLAALPVSIERVTFAYGAFEPQVFSELCIEVSAGECVAITGRSGSGKSTLARLLTGGLEPQGGRILVGGFDMRSGGSGESVYASIASVMQADHLITGTVYENIDFFRGASKSDIREAAETARIDSFVMSLPMRYETPISDLFAGLSGGQRQRILVARALVGRPSLLVMDEATSFLDVALEKEISVAIAGMAMTRIIFAHREETIRHCHRRIELPLAGAGTRAGYAVHASRPVRSFAC